MSIGRAIVVGAGIGGLAAGAALAASGWQVMVCERAPSLEFVGAGISLWPNALRALDQLDLGASIRARAALGTGTGIRRPNGRWLGRSDISDAVRHRFGDPLVITSRAELIDLLVSRLPDGVLRTGAVVRRVVPGGPAAPALVDLTDGRHEADLVVAADGIDSSVRSALFPEHPGTGYAGYTTWRLMAAAPPAVTGSETWGPRGQRFAIVPMADDRLYCYATATVAPGKRYRAEAAELRRRFGAWHHPIPEIIASVAPDQVLHHDVFELHEPLPAFHRGRVALIGDAAHAMTPELGQGGCLALEDAVTLARILPGTGDCSARVPTALAHYTALRRPRATLLARRSRAAARITQSAGPVGDARRGLAARLMTRIPAGVVARGLTPVLDWEPPPPLEV